ncbi:MAG: hypothetical protein HY060_09090 [Proteobacteria bacterium]|nr:hypothetical protein [Pseudomonadota bacterium]
MEPQPGADAEQDQGGGGRHRLRRRILPAVQRLDVEPVAQQVEDADRDQHEDERLERADPRPGGREPEHQEDDAAHRETERGDRRHATRRLVFVAEPAVQRRQVDAEIEVE